MISIIDILVSNSDGIHTAIDIYGIVIIMIMITSLIITIISINFTRQYKICSSTC